MSEFTENLISIHENISNAYDIFYPFMTFVGTIMYFLGNLVQFGVPNMPQKSQKSTKTRFQIWACFALLFTLYIGLARKTSLYIPLVLCISLLNFLVQTQSIFNKSNFFQNIALFFEIFLFRLHEDISSILSISLVIVSMYITNAN